MFSTSFSDGLKPIDALANIYSIKTNDSVHLTFNKKGAVHYRSNEKFELNVPHYDNDSLTDVFAFGTPESYGDYDYYQEVNYRKVKNHKDQLIGYETTLYNAFFDIEKVSKRDASVAKEKAYSAFVKNN